MRKVSKVIVSGDHYAVDLVKKVEDYLTSKNISFENRGSKTKSEKISLQEMIPKTLKDVEHESNTEAILICGTGVGVEVGANRFSGVRASLCTTEQTAKDARKYDKANTICLSAWQTEDPTPILDAWFTTEYDGDEGRLEMFKEFDRWAK